MTEFLERGWMFFQVSLSYYAGGLMTFTKPCLQLFIVYPQYPFFLEYASSPSNAQSLLRVNVL